MIDEIYECYNIASQIVLVLPIFADERSKTCTIHRRLHRTEILYVSNLNRKLGKEATQRWTVLITVSLIPSALNGSP